MTSERMMSVSVVEGWGRRMARVGRGMILGGVLVVLSIPVVLIRGVLGERLQRRGTAMAEMTSAWGQSQSVVGPILTVPYRYRVETWREEEVDGRRERRLVEQTAVAVAYFLPEALSFEGNLATKVLHRGIYEAVVYGAEVGVEGSFARPAFERWDVDPADVMWEDAAVSLGVPDLRGTRDVLTMTLGGREVALTPGTRLAAFPQGVEGEVGDWVRDAESLPFSMSLDFNGSGNLVVAPLGKKTVVHLASGWPDPKFSGSVLPAERSVTADGFDATWEVSFYGRSFPQAWSSRDSGATGPADAIRASLFGVDLLQVVDAYRLVERSIKYAILVVVLVLSAFFLFEALSPVRIHPFQYLLVGFSLCLFYLILLSMSEFVSFGLAYLTGAVAATAMISLYSRAVLRGGVRAFLVAGQLAATYLVLFVILQLQDYALLLGTASLFVVLAAVMYLTRRVDWYGRESMAGG